MAFGRNVEGLTVWKLPVCPENGQKSAVLIPPCVEFTPLFLVFLVWIVETPLHEESTGIHGPIGGARHGEVDTAGNLVFHVMPA